MGSNDSSGKKGQNAKNASSDDFDQSSISAGSEQPSEELADSVVESLERQGVPVEEAGYMRNPDTSDVTDTPSIPASLKREGENGDTKFFKINWKDLPDKIKEWIKANPYQTAFYMVSGVVFFAPAAASGPVLHFLGFGSKGPRAGTLATLMHSKIGVPAAKSGFPMIQSASMGGHAAAAMDTVVRASAVASGFGVGSWGWAKGSGGEGHDGTGRDSKKPKKSKL